MCASLQWRYLPRPGQSAMQEVQSEVGLLGERLLLTLDRKREQPGELTDFFQNTSLTCGKAESRFCDYYPSGVVGTQCWSR